jgi:hypothetical protein
MTIDRVVAVPAAPGPTVRVAEIMDSDPDLFVDERANVADLLDRPAFQRVGRAVVRTDGDQVGILSATEVERAVRAERLLHGEGPPQAAPTR